MVGSMKARAPIAGALLAIALVLQGCSQEGGNAAAPAAESGETDLAKAIAGASDLSTLSQALKSTGLGGIFANAGSYTLIAPTDAAFAQLGDKAKTLESEQDSAALTEVVRSHLVPGYLTQDDIAKAIEANAGKPVKMVTLGSTELTFGKDGETITVTSPDGTRGHLAGEPIAAGPSVALPIDTVLKPL